MADSDAVPVFVELSLSGREGNPPSIVRGVLRILPERADPGEVEPGILNGAEAAMGSVLWKGRLWRRPAAGEYAGPSFRDALSQSAFGLADVPVPRSRFVDFRVEDPLPFPAWRDEVETLRERLSGGLMVCGGRVHVAWTAPRIRVHWARQPGSAPSMSLCAVGGREGPEDTFFPLAAYGQAEALLATHRKSAREGHRLIFAPGLLAALAEGDGTDEFAEATADWIDARFAGEEKSTSVGRYGLLPSVMLADLHAVRSRTGGPFGIIEAVSRLHACGADVFADRLRSDLDGLVSPERIDGAVAMAVMVGRMVRLAAARWAAIRQGTLSEDDEAALSSLAGPGL